MTGAAEDELDRRPSPEELLARYGLEAGSGGGRAAGRGRLRLYVGMAPGVGKTYRMLEEGHRRLARGTDVVVGLVETHGRPLTAALIEGLEVVPRRRVEYQGITLEEMDTDAVVRRAPTVALVDELAHTNVPGSARAKRWEDVEVIRDAGIHVVGTLNVQHLDSLADAVETITGAPVRERVPDEVLLGADELELVDMSPHALRQRMRHGNIYPDARSQVALERFFTEANLTALRELSLRVVARRVESQLEDVNQGSLSLVSDRVLVLVDGSPASALAVRRAAALAGALHGSVLAVVPPESRVDALPFDRARDLREALDDATELGARTARLDEGDPLAAIVRVAKEAGATHVFVPVATRGLRARLGGEDLASRLAARLPRVDVHLVSG